MFVNIHIAKSLLLQGNTYLTFPVNVNKCLKCRLEFKLSETVVLYSVRDNDQLWNQLGKAEMTFKHMNHLLGVCLHRKCALRLFMSLTYVEIF